MGQKNFAFAFQKLMKEQKKICQMKASFFSENEAKNYFLVKLRAHSNCNFVDQRNIKGFAFDVH